MKYKVKIDFSGGNVHKEDYSFKTTMPVMPKKKDVLGIWMHGEWVLVKVTLVIYEFDEDNKYEKAEINVSEY